MLISLLLRTTATPLTCVVQSEAHAQILASKGCDSNAGNWQSSMGFDNAIERCNLALVRFFLDHGAPVDQLDEFDTQPLHNAVAIPRRSDKLAIAQLLLYHGALINGHSPHGTPLCYNLKENYPELTEFLLANGADVHDSCGTWGSPLHRAARLASPTLLALILRFTEDINQVTPGGKQRFM